MGRAQLQAVKLETLHLSNIRNYQQLDLQPAGGLNIFVGRNAQGKSNLLEAIAVLGTGKSFRTARERDLIMEGLEIAAVSGEAQTRAGSVRLACTVTSSASGFRKTYSINGGGVRYANFLGNLRVVTFVPSDLQLVTGPPAGRRSLLNSALAQEQKTYYHALARYQKTLAQKSALLKTEGEIDRQLIEIYNDTLVETGTQIVLAREQFAGVLAAEAARMHAQWSVHEHLEVKYHPNVAYEAPTADAVAGALAQRLKDVAVQERARQTNVAGPHRDDLDLLLDGRSLAAFGSQGQQRTAVLALKVAEYSVMQDRSGEAPLLLLDDVLSELDPVRAAAFMEGVGTFEQAFMTATHLPEGLPPAAAFTIDNGTVLAG